MCLHTCYPLDTYLALRVQPWFPLLKCCSIFSLFRQCFWPEYEITGQKYKGWYGNFCHSCGSLVVTLAGIFAGGMETCSSFLWYFSGNRGAEMVYRCMPCFNCVFTEGRRAFSSCRNRHLRSISGSRPHMVLCMIRWLAAVSEWVASFDRYIWNASREN